MNASPEKAVEGGTAPTEAQPSAVAAAVQETVAATQAANTPEVAKEPTFTVSGPTFFNICQYVGGKPLRQVIGLRQGLWQIQKEQNCLAAQQLPEKVWLTQTAVGTLMEFLAGCPCDEVFDVLSAFEREVQASLAEQQQALAAAQEAAAAKTLADVAAAPAADTALAAPEAVATPDAAPEAQPEAVESAKPAGDAAPDAVETPAA